MYYAQKIWYKNCIHLFQNKNIPYVKHKKGSGFTTWLGVVGKMIQPLGCECLMRFCALGPGLEVCEVLWVGSLDTNSHLGTYGSIIFRGYSSRIWGVEKTFIFPWVQGTPRLDFNLPFSDQGRTAGPKRLLFLYLSFPKRFIGKGWAFFEKKLRW